MYEVLSTRYQVEIRIEIEVLLLKDPYYLSKKGTRDKKGIRLCSRILAHSRIPTWYFIPGTLYPLQHFSIGVQRSTLPAAAGKYLVSSIKMLQEARCENQETRLFYVVTLNSYVLRISTSSFCTRRSSFDIRKSIKYLVSSIKTLQEARCENQETRRFEKPARCGGQEPRYLPGGRKARNEILEIRIHHFFFTT